MLEQMHFLLGDSREQEVTSPCVLPGAQGDGGLLRMRAAPVGDGGLLPAGAAAVRSEWEGSESRCRGDRALQSSGPLEAAAVAELQVALALRGCRK